MKHCDYFKLQAKNLIRDYKTQYWNEKEGVFDYEPRFFDVNDIVLNFDLDEDKPFKLMNAQHIIAKLAGFDKWAELIVASEAAQEIGKLLFDMRHETGGIFANMVPSVVVENWKDYLANVLLENSLKEVDDETKLEIFKRGFLNDDIPDDDFFDENHEQIPREKLTKELYAMHNPFADSKWDTQVKCLHCDKTYLFNDAEVDALERIVCPVEDCDGTLMDMMPAEFFDEEKRRGE